MPGSRKSKSCTVTWKTLEPCATKQLHRSLMGVSQVRLPTLVLYGVIVIGTYCIMTTLHYHQSSITPYHTPDPPQHGPRTITTGDSTPSIRKLLLTSPNTSRLTSSGILEPVRDFCNSSDLFLVVYVHSGVRNFAHRALIRSTWGNLKLYPHTRIELMFMLARPDSDNMGATLRDIRAEMQLYEDTVMLPFREDYMNMTSKALMAMDYVLHHCAHAPFVLKLDDDIMVDMFSVLEAMYGIEHQTLRLYPSMSSDMENVTHQTSLVPNTGVLMCHVWIKPKPYRDKSNKWYISEERYPHPNYPNTCSGSAWVLTMDVLRKLRMASLTMDTSFPFDDILITGFSAERSGIPHLQLKHHYDLDANRWDSRSITDEDIQDKVFFHVSSQFHVFQRLWQAVLARPTLKIRPILLS